MYFWWFANLCNIILSLYSLQILSIELRKAKKDLLLNPEKYDEKQSVVKKIKNNIQVKKRLLCKACGDFVTSSNGSGIAGMFGIKVNNGVIGLCGLVSSSIASYEAW